MARFQKRSIFVRKNSTRARRLFAETLEKRMLLTTITSVDPIEHEVSAPAGADISATFDQDLIAGSVTDQTFVVSGSQSGRLSGSATTVSAVGAVATHNPTNNFGPGELVSVTATSGISTTGGAANSKVWQFRTEVTSGSGLFVDSGQVFPFSGDQPATFGDVDGDGDPDVLSGSGNGVLWLNDGAGTFTDSGQAIQAGGEPEFADADGDGDLDILSTTNVFLNDGSGLYTNSGQNLGGGDSVTAGDVDADGDVDVMLGVRYAPNRVWLNNGSGQFSNSGQSLGTSSTTGLALADFDNDGDLDAFAANNGPQNRVWINDGAGNFVDSGQLLGGFSASFDVQVGDIDGDGDADAVVGNEYGNIGARIWLNDGSAVFTDSGQRVASDGNSRIASLKLGDLDGDGDLDIFASNRRDPSQIWLNDGAGSFSDTGQRLTFTFNQRRMDMVDLADVDGDGDLDAWEQNVFPGGSKVWINQNLQPSVALSIDSATVDEAGGTATVTATLSETHTFEVTIDLGFSGDATETEDYTASAAQITIPVGSTSGSVTITAVDDPNDEPDESVVVDIINVSNADEAGTQQVSTTITDDDEALMPDVTLRVDPAEVAEDGGASTVTVTLSEATTAPVTIGLALSGTAEASDFSASGTDVVIAAGATSGSMTVTAIQDEVNEPDETVIIDIASVTGGNEDGDQQQTITIIDDDIPPTFAVTSMEVRESSLRLEFANSLDAGEINLFDTQNAAMGAADLVLTGAAGGPVAGSLLIGDSAVTFIKSGDPLAADDYTLTLRSAEDGFKDVAGALLDGDEDGTAGGDYLASFTIDTAAADARTIQIPDFVRGPGQDVNLPADGTAGIPITISDGDNVRAADLRINYDPALVEITGATAPAGGSVIVNTTSTPGEAILVFFSSTSLPAGPTTFINLQAAVPAADASTNYGRQQVLDIHSVTIGDGNDNEFAVIVDDAYHFATYFADVSGNGRINASDAAQVARFAALIDTGFLGSLNADPITVGDISGNGRINAADASRVAQFAALIEVPEIPPVPGGVQITGLVNPVLRDGGTAPLTVGPLAGPSESGTTADSDGSDFRVVENFVSQGGGTRHVDQVAVDRMMAELGSGTDDEQEGLDSEIALSNTLDEM